MRKSKIFFIPFLTLLFALSLPLLISADPGSTDSNGGHYNRKTAEYHYHIVPKKSKKTSFAEKIKKYTSPLNETASSYDSGKNIDSTKEEEKKEIVYISKTGKKYHQEGCGYLKSKIPMEKEEAIKKGYGPCKLCNL